MTELAQQIIEYIRQNSDATFGGLMHRFPNHFEGDRTWEILPNVVLWTGMTEEFVKAMMEVKPKLEVAGTSLLVYMIDGGLLKLPIAKRPTKKGYKTEHWLPVIFRVKA